MTHTFRVVAAISIAAFALSGCGGGNRMASMPPAPTDSSPSFSAMAGEAQTWNDAEAVNLTVPAAVGGDGTLSYAATGLPPGVSFDPSTRTLSGTPALGSGTITITVTDMDADGEPRYGYVHHRVGGGGVHAAYPDGQVSVVQRNGGRSPDMERRGNGQPDRTGGAGRRRNAFLFGDGIAARRLFRPAYPHVVRHARNRFGHDNNHRHRHGCRR